ncbi:hypothetical protein [Spiroplasma endosymbiont of Polydrusus pterygomalis]
MNIITRIQEFLNENNNSFIDLINEIRPNIPIKVDCTQKSKY